MSKLDRRVITVWRWALALWVAAATVIAGVAGWILHRYLGWWPLGTLVALCLLVGGVLVWKGPPTVWANWSFELTDDALELMHGVVFREHSVIPWSRVQHVDISHGPLDRRFGIARLKIHTASSKSDSDLPGLDAAEAEQLRLDILRRYQRSAP